MNKEELKHEAKVYSNKLYHSKLWNPGEDMLVKAYLAGAEPREKQIQIDAEQIMALQKQNGELTDKLEMGIALKDEEISCILTDFNTFKSETKEIIKTFLGFVEAFGYSPSMDKFITETEQFLKEIK